MPEAPKKVKEWMDWKIGDLNRSGEKIVRIHTRRSKYILYEVEDGSVRIAHQKLDIVWPEVGQLIDEINCHLTTDFIRRKYSARIGKAMRACLDDNIDHGYNLFESILKSISTYKTIIGRLEYLLGSLLAVVIVFLIVLTDYFTPNHELIFDSRILIFGSLGGILSILLRLRKVEIDSQNGITTLHLINGASRILVAAISSIILYYLMYSEIILGFWKPTGLDNSSKETALLYVVCVVSEFSEGYVPSLLENISTNSKS